MSCVADKGDNMAVIDSDSHFSEFVGVHPSKIRQGKFSFLNALNPRDRETVFKRFCKKNQRFIYTEFEMLNSKGESVLVYCMGENEENSELIRLTFADISNSEKKRRELKRRAKETDHLIDLVNSGVCRFKVTPDMHIEAIYLNEACCRLFGTTKASLKLRGKTEYRLDDLIHPDDKTLVFQAIGKAMATHCSIDTEYRVKAHKDEYIWCKFNGAIQYYDKENNPVFHAVFTDINEIKNSEKESDAENDKFVAMLKSMPGAFFCASAEKPLICDYVSDDFIDFIGYSRKEFFEKMHGNMLSLVSERERKFVEASITSQCAEANAIDLVYTIKIKGAKHVLIEDKRKIVLQEDGSKTMLGTLCDITESKKSKNYFSA